MKRRFLAVLGCLALLTGTVHGADSVAAGEFWVEPPTLTSLGFEWLIDGDDNHNSTVSVFYRKKGTTSWQEGLPLLRQDHERINERAHQYVTPNMFAGSIFDLEPGTDYECRLVMADPDGVGGRAEQLAAVRTRAEPMPAAGGRVFHVYPLEYKGARQEPAFTGLLAVYYTGSAHSDNFNIFPPRVEPGDTILVHAGVYKDNRYSYGGTGYGTVSTGTYFLTQSGTADRPIVIKGAGDGEAVFDGDGAYNLFNVLAANYNYFEGLTFRNTELVFEAGLKNIIGSSGLTFKKNRFENIGRGIHTDWSGSKDFYIADNVFAGKQASEALQASVNLSEFAVKVYGQGHVVAYNAISGFHDGVDVATYGPPDGGANPIRDRMPVSIDFYGNEISTVGDNCLEADGGGRNIRIFRNRCFNHGSRALSVQPSYGGPVYFIRNIVYNAPDGAFKPTAAAAGILLYHNTIFARFTPMLLAVSNLHFRNNLILVKDGTRETFWIDTKTNYSSSDYNGFRPSADAETPFGWTSPPFSIRASYPVAPVTGDLLATQEQVKFEASSREVRRYKTLKEYSAATGQDTHSVLIDYDIFMKASPTGADPKVLYKPADFDFRLRPGTAAVDAGIRLTGVNDGFAGRAPDLGAYEIGQAVPQYGPRP